MYYSSGSGGMIWLLILFGLAFIPASMAGKKGYSFGGFYAFGFFFLLIAIIVAACLRDRNENVRNDEAAFESPTDSNYTPKYVPAYGITTDEEPCPSCGDIMRKEDRFCANCGAKNLKNQAKID